MIFSWVLKHFIFLTNTNFLKSGKEFTRNIRPGAGRIKIRGEIYKFVDAMTLSLEIFWVCRKYFVHLTAFLFISAEEICPYGGRKV